MHQYHINRELPAKNIVANIKQSFDTNFVALCGNAEMVDKSKFSNAEMVDQLCINTHVSESSHSAYIQNMIGMFWLLLVLSFIFSSRVVHMHKG